MRLDLGTGTVSDSRSKCSKALTETLNDKKKANDPGSTAEGLGQPTTNLKPHHYIWYNLHLADKLNELLMFRKDRGRVSTPSTSPNSSTLATTVHIRGPLLSYQGDDSLSWRETFTGFFKR